ncbi:LacI family DNA-binding transcriptional regulator [Acinetobacter rudis]|uniref:LacI family transcriptional regulator n=1 Tax=Acinetobacter rudis CIP 110305 TaxID=421052 RepID=S3MV09_9GAMM|nr:LacI family DNA-binding transcriptional regulator [Acinetobacter rudis]EPF70393.1 LacI family transcriptional regulator [Acinetobacter rudis CIP 110305]
MSSSKKVNLKYISNQLGLHVSTVSRVLNGTGENAAQAASPETIKRIRQFASDLNYQPNTIAKSLKSQKTNVVGVLVPKLSDIVLANIYEGIDLAATQNDYFTFVSNTHDLQENQRILGNMALSRKVDGLIIADAYASPHYSNKFLYELTEKQIPFILVSRRAEEFVSVTCDDYLGGELAAQHLIELGHTNFGIISGQPYASTGILRSKGFYDKCFSLGIKISDKYIISSEFDVKSGYQAGLSILAHKDRPTAIFAVNDFLAIGLMGAAVSMGIQPGKDLAIVGFNNIDLAEHLPISLTSISSPMQKMGSLAMELLIKKIKGQKVETINLKPTLICRDSTLKCLK